MLWSIVYEFFIKNVFGGVLYIDGVDIHYNGALGCVFDNNGNKYSAGTNWDLIELFGFRWSLGNYLSLIATIISMVVIVVLACLFIKKIYNMVAHVIA